METGNVYNGVEAPNAVEQLLGLSPGTVTRPASYTESNDWNVMFTRAELDIDATFNSNLKFVAKVRGLTCGIFMTVARGRPTTSSPFRGDCATRLEVCGEDYMSTCRPSTSITTRAPFGCVSVTSKSPG